MLRIVVPVSLHPGLRALAAVAAVAALGVSGFASAQGEEESESSAVGRPAYGAIAVRAARPAVAAPAPVARRKEEYTLFRPTPVELLRELSTDRPDRTESPY